MSEDTTTAHETADPEQGPTEVSPAVTVEASFNLRFELRKRLQIPRLRIPRPSERAVGVLTGAAAVVLTVHQHGLPL